MEIKANELKNGDKGIITHWVNQPDYVGNTIEMTNDEVIMTDKNGFKTKNVDMRHPHFCKVQLKCDVCGSDDIRSHSEGLICGDCNNVMSEF